MITYATSSVKNKVVTEFQACLKNEVAILFFKHGDSRVEHIAKQYANTV